MRRRWSESGKEPIREIEPHTYFRSFPQGFRKSRFVRQRRARAELRGAGGGRAAGAGYRLGSVGGAVCTGEYEERNAGSESYMGRSELYIANSELYIANPERCIASSERCIANSELCIGGSGFDVAHSECCFANSKLDIANSEFYLANRAFDIAASESCIAISAFGIANSELCIGASALCIVNSELDTANRLRIRPKRVICVPSALLPAASAMSFGRRL
jgi:hypothetical protein